MKRLFYLTTWLSLAAVAGCSAQNGAATRNGAAPSQPSGDSSQFVLKSEPAGAAGVIQARKEAKHRDDVVIVGRIGGSDKPWVEGRAGFTIVDLSLQTCHEIGGDDCQTPWDFC